MGLESVVIKEKHPGGHGGLVQEGLGNGMSGIRDRENFKKLKVKP